MRRFLTVLLIIIIVAVGVWLIYRPAATPTPYTPGVSTNTYPGTGTSSSTASSFDRTLSDGTITISYPSADFGLATNFTQILAKAVIPPCDENLDYCLYYQGNAYQGTNFESAGIRIKTRSLLNTEAKCLTTPPDGYTGLKASATASSTDYSTSVFSPVSGAAAGHSATGAVYRLRYQKTCYEFETRIGQSQFANYPSGTIQEFTDDDRATIGLELQSILDTLMLPASETVTFPLPASQP